MPKSSRFFGVPEMDIRILDAPIAARGIDIGDDSGPMSPARSCRLAEKPPCDSTSGLTAGEGSGRKIIRDARLIG